MAACLECGYANSGNHCAKCGADKRGAVANEMLPPLPLTRTAPPLTASPARVAYGATAKVGELQSALQSIGVGAVTSRASYVLAASDEAMVWEDSPSIFLLTFVVLKYALAFSISMWVGVSSGSWSLTGLISLLFLVHIGLRYAGLRCTRYRLSSQRLEVKAGLWNQTSVSFEVHQLGDVVIQSPLLFRMLGRANLTVLGPNVMLRGVRNGEAVRDLLRNAGQLEAVRMDKIRWR